MADWLPFDSALRGYIQLISLTDAVRRAVRNHQPRLNSFACFAEEFKLLHRGILSVLISTGTPVDEFLEFGLRTNAALWREPPVDCQTALEEVERIIHAMEPFLNVRNGNLPLHNYHTLFHIEIHLALDEVQLTYNIRSSENLDLSPPRIDGAVPGATEEQINSMPVHTATSEDVAHSCSICVSNFVAEEQIKILTCSHRFHKNCIDSWLRQSATCPMDHSRAFSN